MRRLIAPLAALSVVAPDGEPQLFFMQFWANDDTTRRAKGLAAAPQHVKATRSGADDTVFMRKH